MSSKGGDIDEKQRSQQKPRAHRLVLGDPEIPKEFGDLGMDSDMIEKFTGKLLDVVSGEGPGSGLLSPKTRLLRKGLGLL